MPTTLPVATKITGDIFSLAMWNNQLRDNLNKLLNTGHRVLTVAQFGALTGLEGTKGTVAPDEVYLEVDATNGVQWHLAYESGEATYKWRYIGGPAMWAEVLTRETTTSATYVALTTAGPAIAIPRAGDYDQVIGALIDVNVINTVGFMSYDIGGTGAVDADSIQVQSPSTLAPASSAMRPRRKTALTAVTLTSKYRSSGAGSTVGFTNRFMAFTPVRLV